MSPADRDAGGTPGMRLLLRADFARIVRQTTGGRPVSRLRRLMHLLLPAMQCAVLHRTAHALHRRGRPRLAAGIAELSIRLTGAAIHPGCRIGPGLFVPHPAGVAVYGHAGRDLFVLPQAVVLPRDPVATWQPLPDDVPRLGDGVVLGIRAHVQGAVRIGDGAALGPGVTTLRDVARDALAVAAPSGRVVPPAAGRPEAGCA